MPRLHRFTQGECAQLVSAVGVELVVTAKFGRTIGKCALVVLFAGAVFVAAKAASVTMPYRLSYWEGQRFDRWVGIWFGAVAVAFACVVIWRWFASTAKEKAAGHFALGGVLLFCFLAHPSFVHSRTSVKNHCINQVRQIDGAVERWAESKQKGAGSEVEIAAVIELLRSKKLPECPEGGAYRIGKVGEIPRCAIEEHNLER